MSASSGWLINVALPVALAIALAVFFFVRAARRARRTGDPSPVVSVTLSVSAFFAVLSLVAAASAACSALGTGVEVTVPTWDFWPTVPEGIEVGGMIAQREMGGFTQADLFLSDLSIGVCAYLAVGRALGWLVPGAIAALLAVACFQLLAGRAFAPVIARMTMVTAIIVAVGGVAAGVLTDVGSSLAGQEALQWTTGSIDRETMDAAEVIAVSWPRPRWHVEVPVWPIGAGLGLAALAAVFRYGSALQRDAEGLV